MWVSHGQPSRGRRGIRTHRFTLMIERRQGEADRMILHDNKLDPYQLKNIAGDRPGIVAQLIDEELNPWLKRTSDPWLSDETPD
jgi:hypothetical protein